MDLQGDQVTKDHRVILDCLDLVGHREDQGHQDLQDHQVLRVIRVRLAGQVPQGRMEPLDHRGLQEELDL